ncbi:DUF547 domain-containing protein [Aestuariirhabdus sp. Z084]|uniref:DUF547 domain-containing protein n=1 Tax=Aestuariirhabdus haliotis TaxID=2918751 RepID=UPI00201B3784|nr:DUF547 domain-containing protein [Aestuariirhabdus haliotis]MCL6415754.1 DUF547 domain-containing protein [Aestuariirhabdus haliotis]MCL6419671.1 DUF547 domain-containing protein [Aestuariirhabdus haliotis]
MKGFSWLLRLCGTLLVLQSLPLSAAPASELWPLWQAHDVSSTLKPDHGAWQRMLDRYLVEGASGRLFDYRQVSGQDKALLSDYLKQMAALDPRLLNREQQFAYWVNLYNALTVDLILQHYPIESIRSLGEGWLSFGPWDDEVIRVQGQALTLNDIEHRILRPVWQDPRIHYIVNCASLGCPDLARDALDGTNNETQLELAARRFINQDKGLQSGGSSLRLSSIYDWYAVDFGDAAGLVAHLKQYAEPERQRWLEGNPSFSFGYDWQLNEVK